MVLKLSPKPPASNKSPPAASPDEKLFTQQVDFSDGRRVWVSYPLPDRITFNGYLLAEHFEEPFEDNTPLEAKVAEFASGLKGAHAYFHEAAPYKGTESLWARVQLPMGSRGSTVFIEVRKSVNDGVPQFKMRMEFNPRKVGLAGCKQLQTELHQAAQGAFHLGRFLADASLSRLDVAVDFADVRPADLIVTTKRKEGQRVHYLGTDGALETVQVHRPSKTPGVGTLAVKLYDRNRERKAAGKPAPYPGRQVTRLEVEKRRFPQGFGILNIESMKTPLADVRLSYAPILSPPSQTKTWQRYLAARRGVGHHAAVTSIGVQPIFGKPLAALHDKHPSNLLAPAIWEGWSKGLIVSGFGYLIWLAWSAMKAHTP